MSVHLSTDGSPEGEPSFQFELDPVSVNVVTVRQVGLPYMFELQAGIEQAIELLNVSLTMYQLLSPGLKAHFNNSVVVFIEFAVEHFDEFSRLDLSGDDLPIWRKRYH